MFSHPVDPSDTKRGMGLTRLRPKNLRLCTIICKRVRSARVSVNPHFLMRSHRTRHLQQNAVEMTLGGIYGGILADDLAPVPPSLETRNRRGFPHFHIDGMLTATCPGVNQIGGLPDSCAEPNLGQCCDVSGESPASAFAISSSRLPKALTARSRLFQDLNFCHISPTDSIVSP